MAAAPVRFLNAAAWPLTIWTSLSHLEEHPADDYVERTSPIVATAVAFWICFVALILLANPAVIAVGGSFDDGSSLVTFVRRTPGAIVGVLWLVTPLLYVAGWWMFTARDEAFPR
ncbi:hypothetical protein [Candidatus Viadribacter manganicus]|uniref:Uncharacterized protein n=1 Tax=Candidatus Viadribacter manganicus TaxID=1759059 RepID=A0A1B1AKH6_9PROT|nr:hypothetical protein [Candidatus Viadribacter manganicus]ANP47072.1 hypothetical protein ATE48_14685 [Candidatus Viadribacter manganicus]